VGGTSSRVSTGANRQRAYDTVKVAMVKRILAAALSVLLSSSVLACGRSRSTSQIAWPAYGADYGLWDQHLPEAGSSVGLVVIAESVATSAFSTQTKTWIDKMLKQSQGVFGYVPACDGSIGPDVQIPPSESGACPAHTAQGGEDTIRSRIKALKRMYPELTGIYLDEGPLDNGSTIWADGQTTQQHYQADVSVVHQIGGPTGGPRGWPWRWKVFVEAANFYYQWLDAITNYTLLWENSWGQRYQACEVYTKPDDPKQDCTLVAPPSWWFNKYKTVNLVCSYQPTQPGDVSAVFKATWQRGAGFLYLTDAACGGKLGAIPPFWSDEVTAAK
jgi:hypothetical protein